MMETFQKLDTPLDIYSTGSCFLAAYPNFLVIGSPIVSYNTELYFEADSYIKIFPTHYKNWFKAFMELMKEQGEKKMECTVNFPHEKFSVVWKVVDQQIFSIGISAPKNNSNFTFSLIDLQELIRGIHHLLIKPFCLPSFVDTAIFNLFEKKNSDLVKKMSNINETLIMIASLDIDLKQREVEIVGQHLMRLKEILELKMLFSNLLVSEI